MPSTEKLYGKSLLNKILLKNYLCPGDILVMSVAIECLHSQYPEKYLTAIETPHNGVYENNPHIVQTDDTFESIDMNYPLIQESNQRPVHFIQGYVDFLASMLKINLKCEFRRPFLYLSDEEKSWINQAQETSGYRGKFWLVSSGIKDDYTVKAWGTDNYQEVINKLRGRIQFVQVGDSSHYHPPLDNVINLVGKTDIRQLIRLAWHAQGGIGAVSFLHHVFAAFEKPFVCLASGFEPVSWEKYQTETFLCKGHYFPCGHVGGCWKGRADSQCDYPVFGKEILPKCMLMIKPDEVVQAIESYYYGGVLSY